MNYTHTQTCTTQLVSGAWFPYFCLSFILKQFTSYIKSCLCSLQVLYLYMTVYVVVLVHYNVRCLQQKLVCTDMVVTAALLLLYMYSVTTCIAFFEKLGASLFQQDLSQRQHYCCSFWLLPCITKCPFLFQWFSFTCLSCLGQERVLC